MANDTDGLLTAQNARIQNLEAESITQGQGLLALEQTQQQILSGINAINSQLKTMSVDSDMPSDYNMTVEKVKIDGVTYEPTRVVNDKWHYHIQTDIVPNDKVGVKYSLAISANYQTEIAVNIEVRFSKMKKSDNSFVPFTLPVDTCFTASLIVKKGETIGEGFSRQPIGDLSIHPNKMQIKGFIRRDLLETSNSATKKLYIEVDVPTVIMPYGLQQTPVIESGNKLVIVSYNVDLYIRKIHRPKLT